MGQPTLPDKVRKIHGRLRLKGIPHAFGGALALAYYAEPRVTIDIDLNVFVEPGQAAPVFDTLSDLGADTSTDLAALERRGQCRIWWGRTPLDLFFAYDPIHDAMQAEIRTVPFGDATIPILAPEHLAACKLGFDRPKDWIDIEQMLICVEHFDTVELLAWSDRIVGKDDPRAERIRELVARTRGGEQPG